MSGQPPSVADGSGPGRISAVKLGAPADSWILPGQLWSA